MTGGAATSPEFEARVLQALPAAAFVIDAMGTVLYASERAGALVGHDPAAAVGMSVLSFVNGETAWAYAAAVAMATDYPSTLMGPMRVTVVSEQGQTRRADLWASNHLDDPHIEGIVCLLTEETAAVGLGEAIAAVAAAESLPTIAAYVCRAMRGHPVVADAAVVVPTDDGFQPMIPTDLPPELVSLDKGNLADASGAVEHPLPQAFAAATRVVHRDSSRLPARLREAAERAGYGALWVEPVPAGGEHPPAALVLCRAEPGEPSPNELNSIHQAAGILAVAFTLDRERS